MSPLSVRESAAFIANNAKEVRVSEAGVCKAADWIGRAMKESNYSRKEWGKHQLNPSAPSEETIAWIFVVDALNFSFWTERPESDPSRYGVRWEGVLWTGYWSLCACINRALASGTPITDPAWFARASDNELALVFRSDTADAIPLLEERIKVLRECGQILLKEFQGSFIECIRQAGHSATALVRLIVSNFPCFRDAHLYQGREVAFYKRAQILVADIWACCDAQGLGQFDDIDSLTMFADYRVPQALIAIGALEYGDGLWQDLSERVPILPGSERECEIRGGSIHAVECIRQELQEKGIHTNAVLLDFFLWDYAKRESESLKSIPIHHTRSIWY
ncbi:hypothetical protein BJ684DRAFT_19145 [Piptocephalis cylindrospora]|uniref:Queuosine 5'-phosphate N-glycosylase/hydrolase n=1 Tax=Piptocephalis cylindrospora TaxID=1907219 RepID=A0A4P9Y5Y1_9FUNG|nr:hypothetical protein BJ684DRAFT_19145 [Piptocephalis cylindrospora]|eukprot:RKP14456.1 hypothetical protein BJ684DRAFT_19145 [Piptocephalis cylindrospora]